MDRTITIGDYRFNEKEHLHELLKDGEYKPLTGVTTVLGVIAKPMLIQWSANEACKYLKEKWGDNGLTQEQFFEALEEARVAHRKKKESAGEWGTEVHSEIEKIIKEAIEGDGTIQNWIGMTEIDTKAKAIIRFIAWAQLNKVKFLASEKHVYSKRMWVGGICDIICEIDGKRYVGDIKTSSGIYPEAFIQASAYAAMFDEMKHAESIHYQGKFEDLPSNFDGVVIINLKKDGGFDYKYNYDIEGNFKCFQAALTIYRQLNAIK